MFTYQKTNRYFAQIASGLEELGATELSELGATDTKPAFRGIYFDADKETLYRINYMSRLFTTVLAPLLRFDCHSTKYLYKTAKKINWQDLLTLDTTFAISANVTHSRIRHSQYAAQCMKDAIVDLFRDKTGKRPSVDTKDPDVRLNLHVENNKATIYLDTSGGSLHRRGYRKESVEAPMQETLAAAIIRLCAWDGSTPLVDPMCGSGTLISEALMHFCRIPAAYLRPRFGFESMPDFDAKTWKKVKKECDGRICPIPEGILRGSDLSKKSISAAKSNISALPHGDMVHLQTTGFQQINDLGNSLIVSNPPYGIRLNSGKSVKVLLNELGSFLKHRCTGSNAYLYFGKKEMLKQIGLRPSWKKDLMNGGLKGVLVKYELY